MIAHKLPLIGYISPIQLGKERLKPLGMLVENTAMVFSDMSIVVAVHRHRVGIVQERPPAKNRDLYLSLQRPGKGLHASAL